MVALNYKATNIRLLTHGYIFFESMRAGYLGQFLLAIVPDFHKLKKLVLSNIVWVS